LVAPYNEYQHFLYEMITGFRCRAWTFNKIADWLNENDYPTPRGNKFRSPHVHSIVKKKKIRDVRLNKMYEPVLSNFSLQFIDNTIINHRISI
jgi:hypothetical protein